MRLNVLKHVSDAKVINFGTFQGYLAGPPQAGWP